jgi:hypothetical protein
MADRELVLYRRIASRAFPVLWMLEELGLAYRDRPLGRPGGSRPDDLIAVSPAGDVCWQLTRTAAIARDGGGRA